MSKLINTVVKSYSIVSNDIFTDRRLDYRSKGILCTLLSLPDGWDFSIPGLVELVTPRDDLGNVIAESKNEGKYAIREAIHRLEDLGYLERIQSKGNDGRFVGYDYKINIPPVPIIGL